MPVKTIEHCVGGICTPFPGNVPTVDKPRALHQHQRTLRLLATQHNGHHVHRHQVEKHQRSAHPQPTIAPIHSLPVELLSRVFSVGAQERVLDREIDPREPEDPQVPFEILVSRVCRRWRQIALDVPALWRLIVIRKYRHLQRAEYYLARSQKLSVDIVIDTPSTDKHLHGYTLHRDEIDSIFKIVIPHLQRWRLFTLKVRDSFVKDRCRHYLGGCGPARQLESLKLYHLENWPDAEVMYQAMHKPPVCFGGELPRVQHLSLVGVSLPWKEPPYWRNLKSLELRLHGEAFRPEYEQWERILLNSPSLERLALHYSGPRFTDDQYAYKPIPLPNLRELVLVDLDGDHLCNMLRHMHMPNIRTLKLDLPDQDVTPFVELASDPTRPMFGALELLGITSLECSAPAWRKLLLSVTNLITLEVDLRRMHSRLMDEIMTGACKSEILARQTIPSEPLPSMLMPVLKFVRVKGITGTALQRLSSYRTKGGCEVKKWMLDAKSKDEVVEQLRTSGVNIEYFDASDDEQDDDEDEEESSDEEEEDEEDISDD